MTQSERNLSLSLDFSVSRRRERPGAALLREGESDADAFLAQGELEMKKGSDGRRCLFYLDKAVELNDYDEEVKSTLIIIIVCLNLNCISKAYIARSK